MTVNPSDRVQRQVHRLFHVGTFGTMPDAQLLDRFVSRRDEAAEAAFEALVIRHGPMVLRVCRSVLRDAHDAEDAFQAVFLVLANRARSIRASGSVASWLFGVAQRVASRGKRSALRRQALHQLVAERTSEGYLPAENDHDGEILHEEVDGLPERLRTPIVLCYLQGLTYAAAAQQLGLSETALRGRLARARDRLRQRLTRRGVTVPAGLLVAGTAGQAQAAVPTTLIHSTVRIALGFLAGNTAAILARGVLNAMLLDQLRVATVLVCLGLGAGYGAWHALALADDEKGQTDAHPAVVRTSHPSQPPRTDRYGDPLPPGAAMRLGTVRFRQNSYINRIAFSPDSRFVMTDDGELHRLQIWDARGGEKLRQIDAPIEGVRDFALSPDGKLIAAIGFQYEPGRNLVVDYLTFTDLATGRLVRRGEWDEQSAIGRLAYAPDGSTVATMSQDRTLRLWDVATAKIVHRDRLGEWRGSPPIAFSPDAASHLLAIAAERIIHLRDVAHFRDAQRIAIDKDHLPICVSFSPDGTTLAAGVKTVEAEIWLWRVSDGTLLRRLISHKKAEVYHVSFSPDGRVLAAVGSPGRLMLFDVATGKELDSLSTLRPEGGPVAFSPDGRTLAATGDHHVLHFWDLATGKDRLATPEAHTGCVGAFAFLDDGKTLVSGSDDQTVRIWDLATGRPTKKFPHDGWVRSLSVSADGSLLAAGSAYPEGGKIQVWNLKTGERLQTCSIERAKAGLSLRGLTLSRDESSVIAGLSDGTLRQWDLSTGKERPITQPKLENRLRIGPGLDRVGRAVFSRDGRSVAWISEQLLVVDLASGDVRFKGASSTSACEFAPDGRSLAIVRQGPAKETKLADGGVWHDASTATSTIVWLDSLTGHVRREIVVPESRVETLAFSPDGETIAVATSLHSNRGIIRIFRLRDKREIQAIETPCPWAQGLSFTPDGKQIVAGLADTSIVIWDIRPAD